MNKMKNADLVMIGALRRLSTRLVADWKDTPEPVKHTWLIALTVGWLVTGILTVVMVFGVRFIMENGGADRDAGYLRLFLDNVAVAPSTAVWMNLPGYAHFSIPIVFIGAVIAIHSGRPMHALSILASYFMVALVVMLGWYLWDRPRPDLVLEGALAPGFHSFPSGHIAQAIPTYGLLVYLWVRKTNSLLEQSFAWLLLAVLVGFLIVGRLSLGAHWPSDFVGGILIGTAWLVTLIVALRLAAKRRNKSESLP